MNLLPNESSDIVYTPMTFFMSHCQKFIARNLLLLQSLVIRISLKGWAGANRAEPQPQWA